MSFTFLKFLGQNKLIFCIPLRYITFLEVNLCPNCNIIFLKVFTLNFLARVNPQDCFNNHRIFESLEILLTIQ